jgi:hypothetical protein
MFVVLVRTQDARAALWLPDELPPLPWMDEGAWQSPRPWEEPLARLVAPYQPDELPRLPWMDEGAWQPAPPWNERPGRLRLEEVDQLPIGLDESEWQAPPPWLETRTRLRLEDVDQLPLGLEESDWAPARPWVLPGLALLLWADDDTLPLRGLGDEAWWPLPVCWPVSPGSASYWVAWEADDGLPVAVLDDDGWSPWVVMWAPHSGVSAAWRLLSDGAEEVWASEGGGPQPRYEWRGAYNIWHRSATVTG